MRLAAALIRASSVIFGVVGLGYLLVPAAMLSIVGIDSVATTDFLMRTEGVALFTGAGFLWAARDGRPDQLRLVLAALAGYYVLGSIVDLQAFTKGIVGPASVPSAVVRIALGSVCALAVVRVIRESVAPA